jgi:hypothetical protein
MSDMNGKVALITGASSGIGWATGEALAALGVKVVLAARRKDELATLAAKIDAQGGSASYVVADVSVAKDVERMVAHTIETFGRLDYPVNNAGYEGQVASITDLSEEVWDRVLDINLKGTFLCLQHEDRAMLAAGRGGAISQRWVRQFISRPRVRPGVCRVEAWADRPDDQRLRGIGAAGDQGEPDLPGNHRHPDASARPRVIGGRNLRQHSVATCSHQTRRQPGGDRPVNRISLLRRCQLHHWHYSDTGWGIYSDYLSEFVGHASLLFRSNPYCWPNPN